MYKVKFTNAFKKSYKLAIKRGLDISLLDDVIKILQSGKNYQKNTKIIFNW